MNDCKSTNQPLISIIIPVYNVEKYVEKCLNSIINQSFKDWEMIIVNDGSKDSSLEICNKICKNDGRIFVISQANKGLPGARNTGIKKASGKYLYFIDSDDYLPEGALKYFYDCIELNHYPDFIKGNHLVYTPDGRIIETKFAKIRKFYEEILIKSPEFFKNVILPHPMAWNSMIKTSLLTSNDISFIEDTWPREDLIFNLYLSKYDFSCIYINKPTYVYRLAIGGSLSNSQSIRHTRNYIKIAKEILKIRNKVVSTSLKEIIDIEYNNTIQRILFNLLRINKSDANDIWHHYNRNIPYCKITCSGSLAKRFLVETYNISPKLYYSLISLIRTFIPKSKRIY